MNSKKDKSPTIADVAKLANVSMMTVSRALNRVQSVKPETRERIESAAKSLGYKPNFSAQRLSGGRHYFIGVICFEPNSSYVSQFLFGCIRRCGEIGYHLIVEEYADKTDIKDLVASLVKQVDGVILLPPVSESLDVLHELSAARIPYVQIGQNYFTDFDSQASSIVIDDFQAAYDLTEHLIKHGHKEIGFITGDMKQQVSSLRLEGFKTALSDHGIMFQTSLIAQGDFTYKSALTAAEKLLSSKKRPTAMFCSNDDMAAAVIGIAHRHNLKIPEDLSIVGFDDTSTAIMVWPQLTTVKQPLQLMATAAIDTLVHQAGSSQKTQVPYEVIIRGSTVAGL